MRSLWRYFSIRKAYLHESVWQGGNELEILALLIGKVFCNLSSSTGQTITTNGKGTHFDIFLSKMSKKFFGKFHIKLLRNKKVRNESYLPPLR